MLNGVNFGRARLIFQLSRVNMRYSIISLTGLIIAISFVSVGVLSLDSNRAVYYLDSFTTYKSWWYEELDLFVYDIQEVKPEFLYAIQESFTNILKDYDLEDFLTSHLYPIHLELEDEFFLSDYKSDIRIFGLDFDANFLDMCENGSYLPTEKNEILFFTPDSNTSFEIGKTINISTNYYPEEDPDTKFTYNSSLTIKGLLSPSPLIKNTILKDILPFDREFALLNITNFLTCFQPLSNNLSELSGIPLHAICHFTYEFNRTAFNFRNVNKFVTDFNLFIKTEPWNDFLDGTQNMDLEYDTMIYWKLYYYTQDFKTYTFFYQLFIIPVIFLSFLLAIYSLNLIHEGRRKNLILYRMRGLSKSFLIAVFIVESILLSLLASIFGIICGIIFIQLIGTSNELLSFTPTTTNRVFLTSSTITWLMTISLIITFFAQIPNFFRLLNSRIITAEEQAISQSLRKPRILEGKLGFSLLLVGVCGILLLFFFIQTVFQPQIMPLDTMYILFPFFMILAVISPIFFLVGIISSLNSLIPIFLNMIGKISWKMNWGSLATATRNLLVNQRLTTRTSFFIAISLAFLMILSILPSSYADFSLDNSYSEIGSDIKILSYSEYQHITNLTSSLDSILGIDTTIISTTHINQGNFSLYFMGIGENFSKVAYWRDYFDDYSLTQLESILYDSSDTSIPVLADGRTTKKFNLGTDDNIRMTSENGSSIFLTIKSVVNYWPGFGDFDPNTNTIRIVTTIQAIQQIGTFIYGSDYSLHYTIWCKVLPGYDYDLTVEEAMVVTKSFETDYIRFNQNPFRTNSFESHFFWTIFNFNFLGCFVVILTLIIHFNLFQVSVRKSEIGLSRSLGMKKYQVFQIMVFEPFLLLFLSGLPSAVIGSFFLLGLENILQPLTSIARFPFRLIVDWSALFILYGGTVIVTLISGLILAFLATRVNIVKVLEVE